MKEFHSPRTRILRTRAFGLRYFVVPAIAIAAVYSALSFISKPETVVAQEASSAPAPVASVIPAAPAAPSNDLREAFQARPIPATLSPKAEEGLARIQQKIDTFLTAGGNFLESKKKLSVGKGDTLMSLLVENKVPREEAYQAIQALAKVYNPRDLKPNHEITVFFHQDPSVVDPMFSGLSIEKDVVNSVSVKRDGDGSYKVDSQEKDVHSEMRGFKGKIDSSLYVSAKAQGVPDGVILDLIKMYSWGVDFQRDIQAGDEFEVMYEEFKTEDGDVIPGRGEITYARLTLGDRDLPFYRFKDSTGDTDYYDDKGQSAKKPLMKTPIDGARLSSGFGMRKHPVLGYSKMHKGIDFAAPRGTPIYAAGDGTIVKMGPFSSYGNYVRIRHRSGLETAYAHMSGFKSGLHSGNRIKQGQVIGYVGTTGRSTGPHLHYEILMNNRQVNPASVKLPTGKALKGRDLKNFNSIVASMNRQFKSIGRTTTVAQNTKTISPAN